MNRRRNFLLGSLLLIVVALLVYVNNSAQETLHLGVDSKKFKEVQSSFFNDLYAHCNGCNCSAGITINPSSSGFNNSYLYDPVGSVYLAEYYLISDNNSKFNKMWNCSINRLNIISNEEVPSDQMEKFSNAIFLIRFSELCNLIQDKNLSSKYFTKNVIVLLNKEVSKYSSISFNIYSLGIKADWSRTYLILGKINKDNNLINKSEKSVNKLDLEGVKGRNPYNFLVGIKAITFVCSDTHDKKICALAKNYTDYLLSIQREDGQLCPADNPYKCNPPLVTYQGVQALDYYYDFSHDYKVRQAIVKSLKYILRFVDRNKGGVVENYYRNKAWPDLPTQYQKTISLNYEITRLFYKYEKFMNSTS